MSAGAGGPGARLLRPAPGPERQPWPLAVLRFAVVLAAVLFFAVPLTLDVGVVGAVAGTLAGTVLGQRLARSRLRLAVGVLCGLALALGGTLAARWTSGGSFFPGMLGATDALRLAELLRWFFLCLGLVGALRFASSRHPTVALVEAVLAVASLALALAPHRDGSFHRPLELGDWAWSRGIDPSRVLLALGALTGLTLVPLLLRDVLRRLGRNLLSLLLLALGLLLLANLLDPSSPPGSDRNGLRRDGDEAGGRAGQGRGARGGAGDRPGTGAGSRASRITRDQFPFRDEPAPNGEQESPVAVVVFHDDYRPTTGPYYFRQLAFSQFNGRRLVRTERDDTDMDLLAAFPTRQLELKIPESVGFHRRVRTSVALLAAHPQPFGLVAMREFEPLATPQAGRFVRSYRVVSVVPLVGYEPMLLAPAGDEGWDQELYEYYTAFPADPRYRSLAEQAVASLAPEFGSLPLPRALAVKRWLDENVVYNRRNKHSSADDPVADFLFGDRTGYCVHIAHAAVYMLRSLGVPARVGGGYMVDPTHASGGSSLLIRGGNAHTWPEIYLRGFGWVVVDPTPERSEEAPLAPPDPVLQRMLGEMAREGQGAGELPEFQQSRGWLPWNLTALLRRLPALLLAVLLLLYAVKGWRRLAPALLSGPELTRVAYRAASDRLAELGARRELGETRPAFARRLGPLGTSYRPLSEEVEAACLGWPRAAAPDGRVRELLRRQARELRAGIPLWRRVVGLIDPTSWLRTR